MENVQDQLIQDLEEASKDPIPPGASHVVWIYTGSHAAMLFRAGDGMMIGMQKQETVVFGENRNRGQSRVFIERQHAEKWLKGTLAAYDLWSQACSKPVEDLMGQPIPAEYIPNVVDFVKDSVVQLVGDGEIEIPSGGVHPLRTKRYN